MKLSRNLPVELLVTFLLFGFLAAGAQQPAPQIKLARALEDNRQYESALQLYRDQFQKDPYNLELISGIKRCSLALQKYQELISFYENLIRTNPANTVWKIDLAEVYYLNGQEQRARELWWAEIKKDPQNIAPYRLVAMAMINQRLYQEAIEVYTEALRKIEGQANLHIDIGNLYKQQLKYGQAAGHYLDYYNANPAQKQFLQRQIMNLCDEQSQVPAVIQALEQYLIKHAEQNEVRQTLAGLFLKEKDYERAYNIYKTLDQQKTQGKYLLSFANEAFKNKAYQYAISAHKLLQNLYPVSPYKVQSDFELGRCYFALAYEYRDQGGAQRSAAAEQMARAVSIFDSLAAIPARSVFYAYSLNYLGDIYFYFYFDLDKAQNYYQTYIKTQPAGQNREQVILKLGDLFLCQNRLEQAGETYRQVNGNEIKSQAVFKIIELLYFQGKFKEARERINELITALPSSHTLLNDVLSRSMLLQSYADDSLALLDYAHCELLIFQHKLTEAAAELSELTRENKPISLLAGKKYAHLLLTLDKIHESRDTLIQLLNSFSDDETLLLLAQVEEQLGNYQQALQRYQQILTDFPNSLFIQQARENARRLQTQLKKEQS